MPKIILLPLTILLLLVSGCGQKIPETDYFPMQKGLQWHYDVVEQSGVNTISRTLSVENLGKISLTGRYEDESISIRRTSEGTDYYILQDDTGSYRVAKRTIVEVKPQLDEFERKVIPSHIDIAIGSSWSIETQPYILHPRAAYSLPDPREKTINMLYEVKSLDATVEVSAGVFKNCVIVEGTAIMSMYADPRIGYVDIPITQTEWYAPGVGLVKMRREEPLDLEIYEGGSIELELTSFES